MKMPAGVHRMSKSPKGNDVAGKVWVDATIILPDETIITGRFESKRGAFVYFNIDEQAYRAFAERFMVIYPDEDTDHPAKFDLRVKSDA